MTEGGEQMGNPFLDAIDVIRDRGWHQGAAEGDDGSVCLVAAVDVARGSRSIVPVLPVLRRHIDCSGLPWPQQGYVSAIATWNDDPSRTEEDVILALKHAAETWDEEHPCPFPEPFDMDGDR